VRLRLPQVTAGSVMTDGDRIESAANPTGWLAAYRQQGGGLSYLPGRTPRVEPTSYAILAGVAGRRDIDWLRGEVAVRFADGVPAETTAARRELSQHPWLLALATVALRTDESGGGLKNSLVGEVATSLAEGDVRRDFEKLTGTDEPLLEGALPWRTPSYGWVEPTSWGVLAEVGLLRSTAEPDSQRRLAATIAERTSFLLSRLTTDGAWNYGSVSLLGFDLVAMPQTSAVCLLALAAAYDVAARYELDLPDFDADAALLRLRELEKEESSRLSRAWTQLALLAWRRGEASLPSVPNHGPKTGESAVDALLTLVLDRAKRDGTVGMVTA
jgi:hypothetical protein